MNRYRYFSSLFAVILTAPRLFGAPTVSAADYARAEKVLDFNLRAVLRNARVEAHWFPGQSSFWYRREKANGGEYLLVDATAIRDGPYS